MFGQRISLFRLFGFEVRLDASWFLIAILITWSLATGLFPSLYPGMPRSTYWWMGAVGMLGLFASIVWHEVAHALMARRFAMPIDGITLFIFGGVAEMEEDSPSPRAEFQVAIAGPIASIVMILLLGALSQAGRAAGWSQPPVAVLEYLSGLNGLLVAFNLIPAFPLDGGRVLRSALWRWRGDLRSATQTAARIGGWFGLGLIVLGVVRLLQGDFIGGMWWALIGLFLRSAASQSSRQVVLRHALAGEKVRRFMTPEPVSVPKDTLVTDLVEDYVYRYHHKMLPVVDDGRLIGCVTTRAIRALPRAEWTQRTAGDLVEACSEDNSVSPEAEVTEALAQMSRTGHSRLLVVSDSRLEGVIAVKDLLGFLSMKLELEADGAPTNLEEVVRRVDDADQ